MKFDRSKFKKANVDQVKETVKEAEKTMAKSQKTYAQYASIEEGKNIFRVLPAMNGIVYAPLKVSKLSVETTTYDENGNKTGTEVKLKNISCADIHGKKLLKGKDPIITYINYVFKKADEEYQDSDEKKKFLAPIYGYRNKKGDFIWGCYPSLSYVCYVLTQEEEIKRLQLRSQWMQRMNQISIDASENSALNLDVFSGADDGQPLCISMTKLDKPTKSKKYDYNITAISPKKNQDWDTFYAENAVSDEILKELEQLPTLQELYVDSYSKKDFDMALDGLKRLDDSAGYDIFSDDAFLDEIERMAAMIPEDSDGNNDNEEEEDEEAAAPTPKRSVTKKPSKPTEDSERKTYPSPSKMKAQLVAYIEENYEGEELPDLSLSELKKWYDLMKDEKELPFEDYTEEEEESNEYNNEENEYEESGENDYESDPTPEDDSPLKEEVEEESKLSSTRSRIAGIKNRLKRK